jgi:uncharacterized protein (DUF362 family)
VKPNRREFLCAAGLVGCRLASAAPGKTKVGLVQSSHAKLLRPSSIEDELDYPRIRNMVWQAIEYGKPRVGSLEAKIPAGSWVVLKPNIAFLPSQDSYRAGDVTDFRVTRAVLEYVARKSRAARITIAEGGSYRGIHDTGMWAISQNGVRVDARTFDWGTREFPGWGGTLSGMLRDFAAEFPGKKFDYVDFDYDASRDAAGKPRFIEAPKTARGIGSSANRTDYCVSKTIRNCDFLINLPVMKVHSDSVGITACIKNYVGTAPREVYAPEWRFSNRILHDTYSVEGRVDPWVVDLVSFHPPDYNVVDGIRGLQYSNHNNNKPDQMLRNNVVLAGEDPLAVDSTVAEVMGYTPSDLEFLHLAAAREIGTMDPATIEVSGDDPVRVMRRWGKSSSWHGRCNREWRVTGAISSPMAAWQRYTAPTDTLHPAKAAGGPTADDSYGAAFRVNAEGNRKAFLWAGIQGRCTVELNGQRLTAMENQAAIRIGQFKVPVELRPGGNLFNFRIEAMAAPPQLAVLLVGPRNDGDSVEGIRYSA